MTDSGPEDSTSCWSGTVSKRADMLVDALSGHGESTVGHWGFPVLCLPEPPSMLTWPHLRGTEQDFALGLGLEAHSLLAWALGPGFALQLTIRNACLSSMECLWQKTLTDYI